jgi:hypothetical protein
MDDRFGYTNSRIFGTRIGANGVSDPAGIEIGRLASSAAWNAPSIASLSNQYLVAWVGGRDENGQTDIVAVRLTLNGEHVGETFLVSTVVSNAPPTDNDGDGVPNDRDQCPNTPTNTVVNEHGCSISQICPCEGSWQNHNQYVQCVRDTSLAFVNAGLITTAQREAIVQSAQASNCGRRRPRLFFPNQEMSNIRLNGAQMFLEGDGPVTCVIECSVDLNLWRPISTNLLNGVTIEIRDVDPLQGPRRFYRVREQ